MKDYIEFASTFLAIMFGVHKPTMNKKLIEHRARIATYTILVVGLFVGIITESVLVAIIYFVLLTISLHVLVWAKSDDDGSI